MSGGVRLKLDLKKIPRIGTHVLLDEIARSFLKAQSITNTTINLKINPTMNLNPKPTKPSYSSNNNPQ